MTSEKIEIPNGCYLFEGKARTPLAIYAIVKERGCSVTFEKMRARLYAGKRSYVDLSRPTQSKRSVAARSEWRVASKPKGK